MITFDIYIFFEELLFFCCIFQQAKIESKISHMDCVNEECRIVYMNGANEANEFTQDKQQLNHCMSKFPVQNAHDTFFQ